MPRQERARRDKKDEHRLLQNEQRFRTIFENAPVMIDSFDRNGRCLLWNRECEKNLGWTEAEIRASKDPLALAYPDPEVRDRVLATIRRADGVFREYELSAKDGNKRTQLWADFRLPDGTLISVGYDITERKRADKALQESEEKYRSIFNEARDGIVLIDAGTGRIHDCNPEFERQAGRSVAELKKMDIWDVRPPEEAEDSRKMFRRILENGIGGAAEVHLQRPDGELVTVGVRGRVVTIGGRLYVEGFTQDVSELKRAEAALRDSEEKYRAIFNEARDGIVLADNEGLIVDCNPEFEKQTGRTLDELKRMRVWELRPPGEVEQAEALFKELRDRGTVGATEQVFQKPNGEIVVVELRGREVRVGERTYNQAITRDITQRKRTEEALRERDARLRLLIEQMPAVLWTTDRDLRFTSSLGAGLKSLGLKPNELVGRTLYDYFQTDDPDMLPIAVHRRALDGISAKYETEWEGRVFESHTEPLRGENGQIIGCIGIALDITERKNAEAALKDSETKLRQIIDLVPHMIFARDREGRFLLANYAVAQAYGTTVENLVNARHDEVHRSKQTLEHFLRDDREVITSGKPEFIPEETFVDVFGNERVLQTTKMPFNVPGTSERAVLGIAVDITERKRAEGKIRQSEKQLRALASRVQSAREEESANIAREIHDELGQTLTGLKLDISWIRRRIEEMKMSSACSQVVARLKSMSDEVDQTIQTVRRISTQLRPVILDDLGLMRALEWQAREFQDRTGISCDFNVRTNKYDLDSDRSTAVFRIFQEILTNVARHARAKNVEVNLNDEHGLLVLDVRDDGRGISEEEIRSPRALGLLGMQERAQVCGGNVLIQREDGRGTRVVVKVPMG